ncbi:carbonic anhydrase [Amaricoccus sp.]|uniref:carbonic anhydrase n=1 Tax=Amaricoccus sp. TaxID=1872485 RepID=UPI00262B485A|nr:carbonic anhydrase [Amaricoccus sp.]HRO11267.1 carbonic anhydrase [Amaricoccus sp.]
MEHARPLPPELVERYRVWRERRTPEKLAHLVEAATNAQNPKAMIIACCDSRVLISEIFGNAPGDFFILRNIANLVPPNEADGRSHGTSAAIEYAVIALGIEHLIVLGHYGCGGVRGCHDMLAGLAPELDTPTSFVGTWLRLLKPGFEALAGRGLAYEERISALEREAILVSLENLMTFPFVAEAVHSGKLELHGLWKDIRNGSLEIYDSTTGTFGPL